MFSAQHLLCALAATMTPPQKASTVLPAVTVVDTVDVPVGSPLLTIQHPTAFTSHLRVIQKSAAGVESVQQDLTNSITLVDSGGIALTRVSSSGQMKGPTGGMNVTSIFTFDRNTLALREMRTVSPRGVMLLHADDRGINVSVPGPSGPQNLSFTLKAPAFFGPWSDFVAEELPLKEGVAYRVRLWQPMMGPSPSVSEESHVFTVRGREQIVVLGKTYNATIVEDRMAGKPALIGTMWVVDGPPKLVKWVMYGADGSERRIEQEVVDSH